MSCPSQGTHKAAAGLHVLGLSQVLVPGLALPVGYHATNKITLQYFIMLVSTRPCVGTVQSYGTQEESHHAVCCGPDRHTSGSSLPLQLVPTLRLMPGPKASTATEGCGSRDAASSERSTRLRPSPLHRTSGGCGGKGHTIIKTCITIYTNSSHTATIGKYAAAVGIVLFSTHRLGFQGPNITTLRVDTVFLCRPIKAYLFTIITTQVLLLHGPASISSCVTVTTGSAPDAATLPFWSFLVLFC